MDKGTCPWVEEIKYLTDFVHLPEGKKVTNWKHRVKLSFLFEEFLNKTTINYTKFTSNVFRKVLNPLAPEFSFKF
jgi:hypothetical protein